MFPDDDIAAGTAMLGEWVAWRTGSRAIGFWFRQLATEIARKKGAATARAQVPRIAGDICGEVPPVTFAL